MQDLLVRNVPLPFILCIKSYRFISVSRVPVKLIAEALLMHMSIPPNSLTVLSTLSRTLSSFLISHFSGRHFPPASSIDFAAV